jgi:hypothetical protein
MPRVTWDLEGDRPATQVLVVDQRTGAARRRTLLADTGAGNRASPFEFVLSLDDCRRFGRELGAVAELGGAMVGSFLLYSVFVAVAPLAFGREASAVAVPPALLPSGLDGIAGFAFLNRFTYGNFGDPDRFGLEIIPV